MNSSKTLFTLLLSFSLFNSQIFAQTFGENETRTPSSRFDHAHSQFEEVLKEHVQMKGSQSGVNYKKLKENPEKLNTYLSELQKVSKEQFKSFHSDEKLAFLINAYNGFTLKLIIDHYPIDSIRHIGGRIFGRINSPWKKEFFTLLEEKRSLDEVEHAMIRHQKEYDFLPERFNEPRIHFVLVCAAKSCPPLQNSAYRAETLEEQLERATQSFMNDRERNRFSEKENKLILSRLFDWYGGDFEATHGSIQAYAVEYMSSNGEEKNKMMGPKVKTEFMNYDWALNSAR
jgi:hypothetical protein